jgi:MATE family multidrug resistance protein
MMTFSAPLFGMSTIISRLKGENNFSEIGCVFQQGCLYAILLSLPVISIMGVIKSFLILLDQPPRVIELVGQYFQAYTWSVPIGMLLTSIQQLALGIRENRAITSIGIIGLVTSVFVGYCLTFGKYYFPNLGVAGLGYAQVARVSISLLIFILIFLLFKRYKSYRIFSRNHSNRIVNLKKLFSIGWPLSIHAASEFLTAFIITIFAGWMGQSQLLAQQIASQYILLLTVPILAFSQSTSILVGTSIGKNNWLEVKRYSSVGILLGLITVAIVFLGFVLIPKALISLYIDVKIFDSTQLFLILIPFLLITIASQFFEAIRSICGGALRAFYDTRTAMYTSIFAAWGLGLPLAFVLGNKLWGITGFAIAQSIGFGCCALILYDRLKVFIENRLLPQKHSRTLTRRAWMKLPIILHEISPNRVDL